jgi:hypothetical protein
MIPVNSDAVYNSSPSSSTPSSGGGFASFLNNGQLPAGSTYTSKTSETVLPEWYTNYAMQLLANQNLIGAQPYQPYAGPRVAEFSPTTRAGFDATAGAAGAYQPALTAATAATQGAMAAPGALAAAQPYLGQAGQTSVANIGQYMNPYTEQVVNRIGELGVRNLQENIMPGIEGRYIAAGQLGFGGRQPGTATPSGMMTDTARAIRDTSADILGKQAEALRTGYGEALGASGADLNRAATLASTSGTLAGADISRTLAGADQLAGMGAEAQRLGLTGAGALTSVGKMQEDKAQQNLDIAYADDLRQRGFPQEQIDKMLATFRGVAGAVPTAGREEGIVPLGYQPQLKPSTAETIGGALAGIGGILSNAQAGSALSRLLGV